MAVSDFIVSLYECSKMGLLLYAQTFSAEIHLKFKYLNYNNNNKFEVVHKI